jgi:hypothetical protein
MVGIKAKRRNDNGVAQQPVNKGTWKTGIESRELLFALARYGLRAVL